MAEAVVIGGGGHARVVIDVLRRLGHRVLGYSAPGVAGRGVGVPYLGTDDDLDRRVAADDVIAVLALGKTGGDDRRLLVLTALVRAGFRFPPIVAPTATVHVAVRLGDASVVLDGAIVVTGSALGRACIVNTHATVDHDGSIGDDVHVAPGATVCGGVSIGSGCLIGAGATVVPGVHIAPGVVVAAGATVVGDLDGPGTYVGVPARRVR